MMKPDQPLLKLGSTGEAVAELQRFLQGLQVDGFALHDGKNLGQFDAMTQYGVKQLQQRLIQGGALAIKQPTGNYGPMTEEAWSNAPAALKAQLGMVEQTLASPQPAAVKTDEAIANIPATPVIAAAEKPAIVARISEALEPLVLPIATATLPPEPKSVVDSNNVTGSQQEPLARSRARTELPGPFSDEDTYITSGYGMRHHPVLGIQKVHQGTDFVSKNGNKRMSFIAPESGRVTVDRNPGGAEGMSLVLHADSGRQYTVMHLSSIKKGLQDGSQVEQGEKLAVEGSTGRSTGAHFHVEVREPDKNGAMKLSNPAQVFAHLMEGKYLAANPRSRNDMGEPQVALAQSQKPADMVDEGLALQAVRRIEAEQAKGQPLLGALPTEPKGPAVRLAMADLAEPVSPSFSPSAAPTGPDAGKVVTR